MAKNKAHKRKEFKLGGVKNNVFKELKPVDRELLEQNISHLEFRKGENIIKQGTYLSSIYYLVNGLAKVYIEGSNGKNLIINISSPDNFIGLIDLFSEKYYHCSVMALSPIELFFYDAEIFRKIAQRNSKFASELLIQQTRANEFWIKRMTTLGTKQMHGRLADALLYLSQKEFESNNIYDFLTRTDIAEITGMSKENAIRLLSEFRNDGIITIDGKKIIIRNMRLLERLSLIG